MLVIKLTRVRDDNGAVKIAERKFRLSSAEKPRAFQIIDEKRSSVPQNRL